MYKKLRTGVEVILPFTSKSAFYLEDSHNTINGGCYTIIGAAILSNEREIALLLENDLQGEEDLALVFLSINHTQQLPLLRKPFTTVGAYKCDEAYFIRKEKWCSAVNDIETELDDRCYEDFIVLTDEEIGEA